MELKCKVAVYELTVTKDGRRLHRFFNSRYDALDEVRDRYGAAGEEMRVSLNNSGEYRKGGTVATLRTKII